MGPQSDVEPPKKKQRKAKSCEQCRDRKVRCDQTYPCGPCRRSRDRLTCTYRDIDADHREADPVSDSSISGRNLTSVAPEDSHDPQAASARFVVVDDDPGPSSASWRTVSPNQARIEGFAQSHGQIPTPRSYSEHTEVPYHNETNRRLEERLRRLEDQVRVESRQGSHADVRTTEHLTSLTIEPPKPRLRMTQDKVKLFPQSHWVHTAEKIWKFGAFDSDVEPTVENAPGLDKAELAKAYGELRNLRHLVKAQRRAESTPPIDLSDLHATLPPKDVCDVLVANYLRTFERIYRVVNVPGFLEQYDQFWKNSYSSPKTFVLKLVAILAIGTALLAGSQWDANKVSQLRRQSQQWIHAGQWWLAGPTEKSTQTLHGLQVFCLLIIARQATGLGSSLSLSSASLLSMAMQMGLHRNIRDLPTVSRLQAETTARLWATVVELCLASSLESGAPLQTAFGDVDVQAPSDINDSELVEGPSFDTPSAAGDRTTDTSIQLLLLKSRKLRIQALKIINGVGPQTPYEKVVEIGNQFRHACAESSAFFSAHFPELGPRETQVFHRKYIDMYLRRHILLLHRPFMLASKKDPHFYLSRKMCLESCMIMAAYTDDMGLPTKMPDDFACLMVEGSGHLRGGLSLDVIITLAYELNTQLQEEESAPGSQSHSYDPARDLARAAREPILRRLEHIREQLSQTIALGSPSLKRLFMVTGSLAQIRTLEAGGDVKIAFYSAVKDAIQRCTDLLRAYLATQQSQDGESHNVAESFPDKYDFSLDDLDFGSLVDPIFMFGPPAFGGGASGAGS